MLPGTPDHCVTLSHQEAIAWVNGGVWRLVRRTVNVFEGQLFSAVGHIHQDTTVAEFSVYGPQDTKVRVKLDQSIRVSGGQFYVGDSLVGTVLWVRNEMNHAVQLLVGPGISEDLASGIRVSGLDLDRFDWHCTSFLNQV